MSSSVFQPFAHSTLHSCIVFFLFNLYTIWSYLFFCFHVSNMSPPFLSDPCAAVICEFPQCWNNKVYIIIITIVFLNV